MSCGFTHDSSICPRRFDAFLTPGTFREKLKWSNKSRIPFKIESASSSRSLIELPLTSFVLPYMSNISRISPSSMEILQKKIFNEKSGKDYLMFLTHPNEFVDLIGKKPKTHYRSDYLFGKITQFIITRNRL